MGKVTKPRTNSTARTPGKANPVKTPNSSPPSNKMPKAAKSSTSKTKIRGEKKKKDPHAPKRGLSAYMFYANDNRERVRTEDPSITFGQVGKKLGEEWKSLSDEKKKPYLDRAEEDKKRYEREKAKYNAGDDDDEDNSD